MPERPAHQDGGRITGENNDGVDVGQVGSQRQNRNRRAPDPPPKKSIRQADADQGMGDVIHGRIIASSVPGNNAWIERGGRRVWIAALRE